MRISNPVAAGVMLLGLPRLALPIVVLAGFGMLLNLCHPPCPVDPLSHEMICPPAQDVAAYERALEARAGIKHTAAQWEAIGAVQAEAEAAEDKARADHLIADTLAAARAVELDDRKKCRRGWLEYCRKRAHRRRASSHRPVKHQQEASAE